MSESRIPKVKELWSFQDTEQEHIIQLLKVNDNETGTGNKIWTWKQRKEALNGYDTKDFIAMKKYKSEFITKWNCWDANRILIKDKAWKIKINKGEFRSFGAKIKITSFIKEWKSNKKTYIMAGQWNASLSHWNFRKLHLTFTFHRS